MFSHRLSSSGDMPGKMVDYLSLESAVSQSPVSILTATRITGGRLEASFMSLCWAEVASYLYPIPGGSLRLCTFASACLFGGSLHACCILSLTVSVLPSPFPAHLGELHFCDTVYHIPSGHISSLLFSGSFSFLRENGTTQYLVP